jgi:hypothetical protein
MWNALMTKATIALMTEFPTLFALSSGTGTSEHGEQSSWNFDNFVENAKEKIGNIGAGIVVLMGMIMLVVGAIKIGKGLMTHGQGQTNWVINILLIVVGGLFVAFGFSLFFNAGGMFANEIEELGQAALMGLW